MSGSTQIKNFSLTGDCSLFRYCHNDPIDFTDPMAGYANHLQ